jgi:LacI family transcriptional regulator
MAKQNEEGVSARGEEVAKRAGVSVMTVSRALRGHPNVSPKTRERVLAIANELGYQPSTTARALRTGKVDVIGFATWSHDSLRGSYHSETLAGIDSVLARALYSVLLAIPPSPEKMVDNTLRLVKEGRLGAVVFQATHLQPNDLKELEELRVPCLLLNYHRTNRRGARRISFIAYDNQGGVEQAVRHLVALGHRRIAYIGGSEEDLDAVERQKGFVRAMKAVGLNVSNDWIRAGDFTYGIDTGRMNADYLFSLGAKGPTGIICASDEIAAGVLLSARKAGKHVPSQLSVVGFDNVAYSAMMVPPLTTLNHGGWEIGIRAGEEILRRLRDSESKPLSLEIPVSLVVRESTAPPPQ